MRASLIIVILAIGGCVAMVDWEALSYVAYATSHVVNTAMENTR